MVAHEIPERLRELGTQIAAYLSAHWQEACTLVDIRQIPGGASRETYMVEVQRAAGSAGVVVRRDPPSSLIDTERAWEYRTYQAMHAARIVPVPQPIVLEENPGALQRPFSIMARVTRGQAAAAALEEPPFAALADKLGHKKWSLLGALACKHFSELGVSDFMPVPEHAAQRELDYWANVIHTDALHPQPIAEATIRWLERRMPPPSEHLTLVHGDYRSGNFLYTDEGEITAVLDWEMAHIGDPLEDLAWSLDSLWSGADMRLAGRLLPRQQAIAIWEQASGLRVDPEHFKWWQVFASLKGLAIWISSAEDYVNGTTKEPILALAGWPMIDRQNRILLDRIAPGSDFSYAEPLV